MTNPIFPQIRQSDGKQQTSEEQKGQKAQQQQQQPPRHQPPAHQPAANPHQQYWQGPPLHPFAQQQQRPQQGQHQVRAPVGHGRKQT